MTIKKNQIIAIVLGLLFVYVIAGFVIGAADNKKTSFNRSDAKLASGYEDSVQTSSWFGGWAEPVGRVITSWSWGQDK